MKTNNKKLNKKPVIKPALAKGVKGATERTVPAYKEIREDSSARTAPESSSKAESDKSLPLGRGVKIIAEHPCGLIALYKPSGVKSHPNREGVDVASLVIAPYNFQLECYELDSGPKVYLLNRLDSPTSGVILVATSETVAKKVKALFKNRLVEKQYIAVVKGKFTQKKETWEDVLEKVAQKQRLRAEEMGDLTAQTDIEVLTTSNKVPQLSLIKLTPKTGRTHQLRKQAAMRGHPIAGDKIYGDFKLNRLLKLKKRFFLHANSIRLTFNLNGTSIEFSAQSDVPTEFMALF